MIINLNFLKDRKIYPAIFRVILGLMLLVDLLMLFPYLDEIYKVDQYVYYLDRYFPVLEHIRENIQAFYLVFILILLLFILGIGKNLITFLVFLFFILKSLMVSGGYGEHITRFSLLLFIFVNSFHYLSIQKSKKSSLLSRLATLSLMLHLCLIYFSNAFHKLMNALWLKGDALGYFFLNSQTTDIFGIGEKMLAYPYLLSFMTYFVLIYQMLFPFLIWFRKTKWLFIIFGIIMHLGMALVLQVYFFQIVVILHYGFFIKDEEWQTLFATLKIKK